MLDQIALVANLQQGVQVAPPLPMPMSLPLLLTLLMSVPLPLLTLQARCWRWAREISIYVHQLAHRDVIMQEMQRVAGRLQQAVSAFWCPSLQFCFAVFYCKLLQG